ncbi:MFS transporter [Trinickia symbiotica]|uniref:MFS transporter n=1 Tax=Trinickia symbiotica TaxID=863227 RepID=UPI002159604E|nr:MFS transporter [Trinickia symbiotica]
MTPSQYRSAAANRPLLSLMICVFTVFLVTGAALPALPLHIHHNLGFGTFTVGLVSGAQFASSLVSRLWSGAIADRRGPKFAVSTGLGWAALAGLLYLLSLMFSGNPSLSVVILFVGRALLGGAESFIMTGSQSWCLALAGPGKVGKMIAWIGTSMFVALATGAPLGSFLFDKFGFASIGLGEPRVGMVSRCEASCFFISPPCSMLYCSNSKSHRARSFEPIRAEPAKINCLHRLASRNRSAVLKSPQDNDACF